MLQELNVDTRHLDSELNVALRQFDRLIAFYKRIGQNEKAERMEQEMHKLRCDGQPENMRAAR
ncbi:hypothetical protein KF707_12545 [Candidatus Obscuribacterales bacterium]|nr:hypothetical protein [Candidatus Obscuribacterales bacterium]MBX3137063.1 hypothetical protein [Candidatus Obscuribacterales bacterium]MBX3153525.1 hypothetical protein [Candidatus Obscuribacterales bacterium]